MGVRYLDEEVYDPETGQLLSGTLMDYPLPRADAFDYPRSVIPTAVSTETILFFLNASGVIDSFWRSGIHCSTTRTRTST